MRLPQPYLHTSERMIARIDQPQMWPPEGLITDSKYGYHTIWIAEVPFIPAYAGKADNDFTSESANRLTQIIERQMRFLYNLAQSQEHQTTLELRLVSWPQSSGHASVGIAFLGKTFDEDLDTSRDLALGLWEKFNALFPREAPFSYPLIPIQDFESNEHGKTRSFKQWFEPLPFQQLTAPCTMVELRKYEDWPTVRDVGGSLHARDYIPHPFVPADYSAMARLFETMAHQSHICMVTITIRPQRLTDQEITILHEMANWYQRTATGEITINNRLLEIMRNKLKSDIVESYLRPRAKRGQEVYEHLRQEYRNLFLTRLQVTGSPLAPDDVIEALGSEIMTNSGNAYPSRWTREEAPYDNLRWARFNLQWLEFERWGISKRIQWDRRIIRLRSLATVQEVFGAFRLPAAPSNSGLAGIEVRDEPFMLPNTTALYEQPGLQLGMLLDRGLPTDIPFVLPSSTLAGTAQIYGDKSAAREQVVRHLLSELHVSGIPWRLIRKADTTGAILAQQLQVRHVLVDALASHTQYINPFAPPSGASLTQFTDVLVRMLIAVYGLETSSSLLLRRALQDTYRQAGWTEQDTGGPITPSALAHHIEAILQDRSVPTDLVAQLRTGCVLPLNDLATTAFNLFETLPVHAISSAEPMIVEVGWLGSDTSNALIQGCLWAWFTLAFTTTAATSQQPRGIVGLETAHTIFGSLNSGRSTISPLHSFIQACTATGIGILLIDDRPDLIDSAITNNARVTIITHITHLPVLECSAALIGASSRQRERISRLAKREAVVTLLGSTPELILL